MVFRQWVERSSAPGLRKRKEDKIILWMRTDQGTRFRREVPLESAEGDVLVQLEEVLKTSDGWVVCDASHCHFRCWKHGMTTWTDDVEKATRYARREDAEAVHAEDEDAWRIIPYAQAVQEREARV